MSSEAQAWVWNHSDTNGNDRLVLLFLADQGDDDGTNSFPSMRRIAEKCRINVDTVSRVLARLETVGEILVERPATQGRGYFNRYTLVLGRPIEQVEAVREKARDLRPFRGTSKKAGKAAESSGTRGPGPRLPIDPQTDIRESSQGDVSPPATTTPRACRIPDPFYVDETMRAWSADELPGFDWKAETRKFVDYWRAAAGANARKMDWPATWRNWMRRAADDQARAGRGRANGSSRDRQADARLRLVDKLTGTDPS